MRIIVPLIIIFSNLELICILFLKNIQGPSTVCTCGADLTVIFLWYLPLRADWRFVREDKNKQKDIKVQKDEQKDSFTRVLNRQKKCMHQAQTQTRCEFIGNTLEKLKPIGAAHKTQPSEKCRCKNGWKLLSNRVARSSVTSCYGSEDVPPQWSVGPSQVLQTLTQLNCTETEVDRLAYYRWISDSLVGDDGSQQQYPPRVLRVGWERQYNCGEGHTGKWR